MKKHVFYNLTQITRNCLDEGESIEEMLRRATANNEPIEASAPMIYTAKEDGVMPEFDMRTDRQELALEACDKMDKSLRMKTDAELYGPKEDNNQKQEQKTE